MEKTFAEKAFQFYMTLKLPVTLPAGVKVMNPYQEPTVKEYTTQFLEKFFSDNRKRVFVFGINPGRFGAGITGVTFTDPVALKEFCGIPNDLPQRREPSSEFVYNFISQWGSSWKFYNDFFLTAVSPLGFTKDGNNYNFYDHRDLLQRIRPFLLQTISSQLSLGACREAAIVLGAGKNYKILCELNKEGQFFKNIYPLEHPRFIIQYRRRQINQYLQKYADVFRRALKNCK